MKKILRYTAVDRRLRIFLGSLLLIVLFDAAKFLFIGEPNIINWHSFVHPAWVLGACGALLVSILFPIRAVWNVFFGIYFIIFAASLANQYMLFTPILTYNCMLFNVVFAAIYFLAVPQNASAE